MAVPPNRTKEGCYHRLEKELSIKRRTYLFNAFFTLRWLTNGVDYKVSQNIETVDAYIANAPKDRRDDLNKLRTLLVQEAPNAKELVKYKMPYYELNGQLFAFASQKQYISLYILNTPVLQRNIKLLHSLKVGKGCIRFNSFDQLPITAIKKILSESVQANLEQYNDHC
ncbi:DUF1801 domain-containing protein [Brevibacillus laterosporus]|uniref:DUF1801 domain-containing protein n=1 Tax=Brevibacillus laterosporus TaxID=1465 RepID=A0A518VCX1_BRELA|nr:DUF1801 domain-containing protein [Brevibacillus laterosporus]